MSSSSTRLILEKQYNFHARLTMLFRYFRSLLGRNTLHKSSNKAHFANYQMMRGPVLRRSMPRGLVGRCTGDAEYPNPPSLSPFQSRRSSAWSILLQYLRDLTL